ncbi:hypothetical protein AURDEDRAFT_159155 [Auricularia subglabra TFB-10046 SS5]|nr:hypothetical protein AURDEDRAFT_159155 [Auricularia subglabra TFB-10046 SS5]
MTFRGTAALSQGTGARAYPSRPSHTRDEHQNATSLAEGDSHEGDPCDAHGDAGDFDDVASPVSAPLQQSGLFALASVASAILSRAPVDALSNNDRAEGGNTAGGALDAVARAIHSDSGLADSGMALLADPALGTPQSHSSSPLTSLASSLPPPSSLLPAQLSPHSRAQNLPEKVVSRIFDHLEVPQVPPPSANRALSLMDFTPLRNFYAASVVCQSWRNAALKMEFLWSFIVLRRGAGTDLKRVEQAKTRLPLSKNAFHTPMYISIHWDRVDDWEAKNHRCSAKLFDILAKFADRWRYVELVIRGGVPDGLEAMWETHARDLENFVLLHDRPRGAHVSLLARAMDDMPRLSSALPEPRVLRLFTSPHRATRWWTTVRDVAVNLSVLHLRAANAPWGQDAKRRVLLPRLHTLMFDAVEPADVYGTFNAYKYWLRVLCTPGLRRLGLSANVLGAKVEPFLRQAAKSVDSLVLWGAVSSVELYQLSVLNNVEILTFGKADSCGPRSYEVLPGSFDPVRQLNLFPRLTELRIFAGTGKIDISGSGLGRLYRARGMAIAVVD